MTLVDDLTLDATCHHGEHQQHQRHQNSAYKLGGSQFGVSAKVGEDAQESLHGLKKEQVYAHEWEAGVLNTRKNRVKINQF